MGRPVGIALLGVSVLLGGAVALSPAILSSAFVVSRIVGAIDRSVAGSVTVRSVSLSWLGRQRIEGLTLFDPEGRPVLAVEQMVAERPLWRLLRGILGGDAGTARIQGLVADVVVDELGRPNLQRALEPTRAPDRPPSPGPTPRRAARTHALAPRAFTLELTDARLTVTAPGSPPALFEDLRASVSVAASAGAVAFGASGRSRQADLAGDFAARGRLEGLFRPDGRMTADRARGSIEVTATGLPVLGVDRLLGLNGLLAAALGDRLDLAIHADLAAPAQSVTASARAPNFAADIEGRIAGGTFALIKPAPIRLVVTRGLVERLAASSGASRELRLAEDVPVRLTLERLRSALARLDPGTIAVRATLDAEKVARLTGDPTLGSLTIRDLQARLDTDAPAEAIEIAVAATLAQDGQPGEVRASAEIRELFTASSEPRLAPQLDKVRADAVVRVTNLPVGLIDRLGGQRGLLVEALGPRMTVAATSRSSGTARAEVELAIKTARLSVHAPLVVADTVEAAGPITIDYRLSSRLTARYVPDGAGVTPRPETPIRVRVTRLSAPVPGWGTPLFQPDTTVLHADAELGAVTVSPPGSEERVTLGGIAARLGGASLAALEVGATAKATIRGEPGLLRETLGTRADLSLRAAGSLGPDHAFTARDLRVEIDGERLTARLPLALSATRTVSLTQPARVELTLTSGLLTRLGVRAASAPTVAGPTRVEATVDRLDAPLEGFSPARLRLALNGTIAATGADDAVGVLLGPTTRVALRLDDPPSGKPPAGASAVTVSIHADRLKVDLTGVVSMAGTPTFTLAKPARVDVVLTPRGLEMLNVVGKGQPTIAGPTPVHVEIDRLSTSVWPLDPATLRTTLKTTVQRLELAGDERLRDASLADAVAAVELDGAGGTASARVDARAAVSGQQPASPLSATLKLGRLVRDGRLDFRNAAVDATVKLEGLPTAFLEAASGQRGTLVPLIGSSLRLDAALKLGGEPRSGALDLEAGSQHLTMNAGLKVADTLELSRPATAKLVVTPDAYAALTRPAPGPAPADGSPAYVLGAPVTIEAALRTLTWPIGGDARGTLDLSRAAIRLALGASRIVLSEKATGRGVSLTDLRGSVRATTLAGPIALGIDGKTAVTSPGAGAATATGQLRVSGDLRNVLTPDGKLNRTGLSANLTGELTRVSIAPLDDWLRQGGLLLATMGPEMDLTAKVRLTNMSGPMALVATATHAKAVMNAQLQAGILTLTEPLVADLEVTESLGRRALARIHPIFETARASERPIRLEISHEGTRVPVAPFDLRTVVIERARLELGKVELKTGGLLGGFIGLAQKLGRLKSTSRTSMTAWFTPLLWEMQDGRIRYARRLDLLLDGSQHVATWGTVDQADDRLEMVFAIMPETLDKVFDLENVGPNDAFTIPITGSTARPSVDWARAVFDLGRLRAQAELTEKGRGELGALLGGLAKEVLGGGGSGLSRGVLPPPSIDPLPWETARPTRGARAPGALGPDTGRAPDPGPKSTTPQEGPERSRSEELIEETVRKGLRKLFR